MQLQSEGKPWRTIEAPNAFLHPTDPNASFPQYKKQPLIDFRNDKIEFAGYEFIGGRKKKLPTGLLQSHVRDEVDIEEMGEVPNFEETKGEAGADVEEEDMQIDEEDLAAELDGMKLSSKREEKRAKKKKQMEMMEEDTLASNTKKIKKKDNRRNCKKSRKIMKF